jgi:hypothetical protein
LQPPGAIAERKTSRDLDGLAIGQAGRRRIPLLQQASADLFGNGGTFEARALAETRKHFLQDGACAVELPALQQYLGVLYSFQIPAATLGWLGMALAPYAGRKHRKRRGACNRLARVFGHATLTGCLDMIATGIAGVDREHRRK